MNDRVQEFLKRTDNFRMGITDDMRAKDLFECPIYYYLLDEVKEKMLETFKQERLTKVEILTSSFSGIYHFIKTYFGIFGELPMDKGFQGHVFEACLLTSLCSFLHLSKRIPAMGLKDFVYNNSNAKYTFRTKLDCENKTNQINYLETETTMFRKERNRILGNRAVYCKNTEWTSTPRSSEYEWSLYFLLEKMQKTEEELEIFETYKRIKNLNNDIEKVLKSIGDDDFNQKATIAYKKFTNKLKKIKYENYLKLQKMFIDHIGADKIYYGLNLYRLEKRLRPYKVIKEVDAYLHCKDEDDKNDFLKKTFILSNVWFPKIYQDLSSMMNMEQMLIYEKNFELMQDNVVGPFNLFIDELFERGFLGDIDELQTLLISMINELTDRVFYSLTEIDFSVQPNAQEAFTTILKSQALFVLQLNGYNLEKEN